MQAEKFQKAGDWARYGEELQNLKNVLSAMKDMKSD